MMTSLTKNLKKIKEFWYVWGRVGVSVCVSPFRWRLDADHHFYIDKEDKTFVVFFVSVGVGPFTFTVFN